jgi:hypothetical protein
MATFEQQGRERKPKTVARYRESPEVRKKLLIEATMRSIAKFGYAGTTNERAQETLDVTLRVELTKTLDDTRRQFVAAGLEYAMKHYGIRETAFREGYAVLIFQDRAWEVPADPQPSEPEAPADGS